MSNRIWAGTYLTRPLIFNNKCPDVVFVDPVYTRRIVILLEELIESIKKAEIPFNGLWTLILGLAG